MLNFMSCTTKRQTYPGISEQKPFQSIFRNIPVMKKIKLKMYFVEEAQFIDLQNAFDWIKYPTKVLIAVHRVLNFILWLILKYVSIISIAKYISAHESMKNQSDFLKYNLNLYASSCILSIFLSLSNSYIFLDVDCHINMHK